jgi:hypothetical protein
MARMLGRVALVVIVTVGASAQAQVVSPRAADTSPANGDDQPEEAVQGVRPIPSRASGLTLESAFFDRIFSALSQEEDPDGAINTDRPTFTPANTVVPLGRVQFESGFTFNSERTSRTQAAVYDFPEIAMRIGVANRVEFRTFWFGQTYSQTWYRSERRPTQSNGPSDTEIGFKWQLIVGDKDRKWLPTTALITSIFAPTGGGSSPYSSENVEPYVNLIYGWNLTEKFTLSGSTGYTGVRLRGVPGSSVRADSYERYSQSLVAFFAATERTTLFYEWYILIPAEAANDRAMSFMDGGVIYHPTPNTQLDLRAGFGQSGRPDDFFTGAGFSVRF